MKAATQKLKGIMQEEADTNGITLEEQLKSEGFNPDQIKGIKAEDNQIADCIWHHNPQTGRMQLVDKITHESATHNGGDSLWRGKSVK